MFSSAFSTLTEYFDSGSGVGYGGTSVMGTLLALGVLALVLLFNGWLVQLLWNGVFCGVVSGVRPLKSAFHGAGLLLLAALFHSCC